MMPIEQSNSEPKVALSPIINGIMNRLSGPPDPEATLLELGRIAEQAGSLRVAINELAAYAYSLEQICAQQRQQIDALEREDSDTRSWPESP